MDSIRTIAPYPFRQNAPFPVRDCPTSLTAPDLAFTHLTGESSMPVANALASALQLVGLDWTGKQIAGFMQTLLSLYLVIFAQQRGAFSRAIPRPNTTSPAKERAVIQTIENGKSVRGGESVRGADAPDGRCGAGTAHLRTTGVEVI